ncbi:MAG TPA: poly-beta-1,6 N-acetyl-D-glucosamine export porin PgaA [Burkholderiales bacterium]|jgi:biofilm PGA synthesis protein PgaA
MLGAFGAQAAPTDDALSAQEQSAYQAAIDNARAGRSNEALPVLRDLEQKHPLRADVIGDTVVVLGWAGQDAAAVAQADRIDRDTAPAYVLEGLAGSARRQKNHELAGALYAKAAQRFPERLEPRLGQALVAMDAGRLDEAAQRANQLRQDHPRDPNVLEAYAQIATARRDYFGALAAYRAMRDIAPGDTRALRGEARILARLGTPQVALDLVNGHPGTLSEEEINAYRADSTAHRIRWGMAMARQGHGEARFAELDRALAESDAVAPRALDPKAPLNAAGRQLVLDRISALRARFRMKEAVALYEAMAARPEGVPVYAKADAASAYLYLRRPEKARDLYREVVAADPHNVDAQIGLFYALAESEDHKAALAQIDQLAAATPKTIDAYSAQTTQPNPEYISVQTARAMAPLLADDPGEAYRRMHGLASQAPRNMEAGTAYGSTMAARGWPRRAEGQLRGLLTIDPYDSGALGEHAEALLEMRDYRAAEAELGNAIAADAEDERVVRATRLARIHNMRELDVQAGYGTSSDAPTGNRDFDIDAHLYSQPLAYNYRVFLHQYDAWGQFDGGTGRYDRTGIGAEYRSTRYLASAELTQDLNRDRTGISGSVAYTPDDFWTLRAFGESSSTETPVQARQFGVDAGRYGVGVTWRAHESLSAGASLYRLDFSDGNKRDVALARVTGRVVRGPVYRLEVTGAVEATHASNANVAYFNPSHDLESSVQLMNRWVQWRRYERAFMHRVTLTAGNYWQQGFGSGSLWDARYEQEWDLDDRLVLRYGVGRSMHPYDGVRSARNYVMATLNWRF